MPAPPPTSRDFIRPDSFSVAPPLVGRPLARPRQRLAAMLVDLVLVALLANAGGVFFALTAASLLWHASRRSQSSGFLRRSWRLALRGGAALVLFLTALKLWNAASERGGEVLASLGGDAGQQESAAVQRAGAALVPPGVHTPAPSAATGAGDADRGLQASVYVEGVEDVKLGAAEGIALAGGALRLRRAATPEEAERVANEVATQFLAAGTTPDEAADALRGMAETSDKPFVREAAERVARRVSAAPAHPSLDSLVGAYAAALAVPDSARLAALRPQLTGALAGDQLRQLRGEVRELDRRNDTLQDELKEAKESHGLTYWLKTIADDAGVGFGWGGLYFTAWLALWQGRTPGKRLLRIRVVRLDGRPIGWWAAFERFGGYAAGFATGLLGFAQVLWDRNRMGVHDKISETVVVRE